MRKIFIIGLFAILGFHACKKDQLPLVDNKKPEERISEELEKYKKELVGSENGWKGYLITTTKGGGYSFYINFTDKDRLTMVADYNPEASKEIKESTFQLKQVMAPTLIFDTYNYIHLLSDPNPNVFGGDEGQGYGADFEFEIRAQVGDTLKLEGKKRGTKLVLIKASAADKTFYTGGDLTSLIEGINDYLQENSFLYIPDSKDASKKIQVTAITDPTSRAFSLTGVENNKVITAENTLRFSKTGVVFTTPVIYGDRTFVGMDWDKAAKKLFLVTSAGAKVEVLVSDTPILPLHILIGSNYSTLLIASATSYPGWGDDFISRRAVAVVNVSKFNVSNVPLVLKRMQLSFDSRLKTLNILVETPYGATPLTLSYPYTYEKTAAGVFKFTAEAPTGNSAALATAMGPILDIIKSDTFIVDYFINPGNGQILGQVKSIEHSAFVFTGSM